MNLTEIQFATPSALVLLLLAPVAAWWERRAGRPRRWALARAVLVAAVALAISGPDVPAPSASTVVMLDRSASIDAGAAAGVATAAADAGNMVVTFGAEDRTDLMGAIDSGAAALPSGGTVVLATDGRATHGDGVAAARRALARGIKVDGLLLPSRAGPDAAVVAVESPSAWRAGDPLSVSVHLAASAPVSATVRLLRDGEVVSEARDLAVPAAGTVLGVTVPMPRSVLGFVTFVADVSVPGDTDRTNNVGYALTRVAGPPRVLIVGDGLAGVALGDHLAREGVPATVSGPVAAPADASGWAPWDLIALVDVPAAALSTDQQTSLAAHIRGGAGLMMTAGRQSFSLGGWAGSALGELSPLTLDPPDQGDRDPVTLVLVIDQSASMAGPATHPSISKLDVAREAAALAVESLAPGDTVGVQAYSDEPLWIVAPSNVGEGRSLTDITDQLAALQASGGTRILPALSAGLEAAAASPHSVRHVLLLSDGQDASPDLPAFQQAVRQAVSAGVTLSAIALGPDADAALLGTLAEIGRGRLHRAPDPGALPRLTLEESRLVAGRSERTGAFRPIAAQEHPLVAGIDLNLPPLTGYLALDAKPAADVVLETPAGDPLLTVWQMGLGQVAAWSSDTGEAWALEWTSNPAAASFWAALARRLAGRPGGGDTGLSVTVEAGAATIRLDARDALGSPLDLARVSAVVTPAMRADAPPLSVALRQVAPGAYDGRAPSPPGTYALAVRVEGAEGAGEGGSVLLGGWSWDGPRETRQFHGGAGHLEAITQAGGGGMLGALPSAGPLSAVSAPPLWIVLVAGAALLWCADIADQLGVRRPRRRGKSAAAMPDRVGWVRR